MKKLAGITLITLAIILGFGGVFGGAIYAFLILVMVIMDAVNILKSPDPVTFWQIAGLVFWWFFREVITFALVVASWVAAAASGAGGYALLTGKKVNPRKRVVMNMMNKAYNKAYKNFKI